MSWQRYLLRQQQVATSLRQLTPRIATEWQHTQTATTGWVSTLTGYRFISLQTTTWLHRYRTERRRLCATLMYTWCCFQWSNDFQNIKLLVCTLEAWPFNSKLGKIRELENMALECIVTDPLQFRRQCQVWSRSASPLPFYSVFTADTLRYAVT